ncbi:MAG: L,D-transpeptidase [Candidatus Moranbacteria bacterium]|nr:L,D-transpeptidase [Candidatus Moranbacteria bacterium]
MSDFVAIEIKKQSKFWTFIAKAFLLIVIVSFSGALAAFGAQLVVFSQDSLSAKITKEKEFGPREKVAIVFSKKVDPSSIESGFSISPGAKLKFVWAQDNQELDLKPESYFNPGEKYNIKIKTKEGIFENKENEINLSFQIEDYPKVLKAEPGKENTSISVSSDFKVFFDKPTSDFDINFVIDPFDSFNFEANDEKTEFRIYSKDKLRYETEYKMRITAKVAGEGNSDSLKDIFSGSFQTEKKPYVAPVRSNSAVIPEDQVVDQSAKISSGKYIDINLSKQHLSTFENSQRLGTYRISTGKKGMATPTGNFKIMAKRGRAWSNKYKLFMPYFMQFTGAGHGIHELPEWPGGYKEGAAHLGIPVSHGCVRLGVGPAATVYSWSDIGTPVVIHY